METSKLPMVAFQCLQTMTNLMSWERGLLGKQNPLLTCCPWLYEAHVICSMCKLISGAVDVNGDSSEDEACLLAWQLPEVLDMRSGLSGSKSEGGLLTSFYP